MPRLRLGSHLHVCPLKQLTLAAENVLLNWKHFKFQDRHCPHNSLQTIEKLFSSVNYIQGILLQPLVLTKDCTGKKGINWHFSCFHFQHHVVQHQYSHFNHYRHFDQKLNSKYRKPKLYYEDVIIF